MASRPSGHQPDTRWGEERQMQAQWDQNTGSSQDLHSWSISHFPGFFEGSHAGAQG